MVSCVAFDGEDLVFNDLLNDSNVVCQSVLVSCRALAVPVKVDDVAGLRSIGSILPLVALFEPVDASLTAGSFRDNSGVDIAAVAIFFFINVTDDEPPVIINISAVVYRSEVYGKFLCFFCANWNIRVFCRN